MAVQGSGNGDCNLLGWKDEQERSGEEEDGTWERECNGWEDLMESNGDRKYLAGEDDVDSGEDGGRSGGQKEEERKDSRSDGGL